MAGSASTAAARRPRRSRHWCATGPSRATSPGATRPGSSQGACEAGGAELNQALVAAGFARADGGDAALRAAEGDARAARRGLWAFDAL